MGNNNKNNQLKFASKAPWMTAKKDTPNSGILLDADNIRWELHKADKKKTAELKLKEYTLKLIKNNSKTTWRTYAADAMHGIGEGAMMLNPYTTGAYFGAKALNSATLGNATEAISNAGFAVMPWAGQWLPKLVGSVEAVGRGVNKGMQVLNSPLTGKWTQFGNKEIRLAPGYVGMNGGSPVQVRSAGRMRTIDNILQELRQRFGRDATTLEVQLFVHDNLGLQLGVFDHPVRGRQTVITGSSDAFTNAEANLNRILQGEKPSVLSGGNDDMYEIQLFLGRPTTGLPIKTRSAEEVKLLGRYTEGDLKFPNGSPNPNLRPSWLITGAHGNFITSVSSPNKVASNLLLLVNNPSLGRKELFKVLRDNPRGRSGVLIHTHEGDLSVDSHPLSHSVLEMQGFERIIPTRGYSFDGRVVANPHGYKNLFVDPKLWEIEPSLLRYINADSLNIKLGANSPYYTTRETDGSLIIHETSSDRAVGRIPAREAEDVLENAFNAPIRLTNRHFGINLPKAIIGRSGGDHAQWTFRREIEYPSFGGKWGALGLKKGGKLIKKKK